jgi:hypothetical protein
MKFMTKEQTTIRLNLRNRVFLKIENVYFGFKHIFYHLIEFVFVYEIKVWILWQNSILIQMSQK